MLRVSVRDDGAGLRLRDRSSGFGLLGMRERLALVSGTLSVSSSGSGTIVSAVIPAQAPSSRERSAGRHHGVQERGADRVTLELP